jgi:hypothetical protein
MTSDEPGPGQAHVLEARKRIATLRQRKPAVTIERRCSAHKGVSGDWKADESGGVRTRRPWSRVPRIRRPAGEGASPVVPRALEALDH